MGKQYTEMGSTLDEVGQFWNNICSEVQRKTNIEMKQRSFKRKALEKIKYTDELSDMFD